MNYRHELQNTGNNSCVSCFFDFDFDFDLTLTLTF